MARRVLNSLDPPMAGALLTSLLQEQSMGCSVKRNSDPWACGTAPVINISHTHSHGYSPTHTLARHLHWDHKISATDEGREQCFCAVLAVTYFHYKVLP